MIVMKFGGTSVANCEAITRTIGIVQNRLEEKPIVVVSALSKVTDLLYRVSDEAKKCHPQQALAHVETLRERHIHLLGQLLDEGSQLEIAKKGINAICDDLSILVRAVCMLGELTPRSQAKIIGTGEILSSTVIWHAMNQRGIRTSWIDARRMIITDNDYLKGKPIIPEIEQRVPVEIDKNYKGKDAVITQGFIASTIDGQPTVLGRGGSDYTASLIGMAINASAIEIWTDVDGVRTADPRRVPNTMSIERLSFEEAAEMAHFGAKVLHPLTIEPAIAKNIPVYVLNSTNPLSRGTAILQSDQIDDGIKSISFKENIYLLNIFSTGMIEVSGFLSKVFKIFADSNVSVDLISTSEANISITIDSSQQIDHVVELLSEFATVKVHTDKAQVSIIGKNVAMQRGLMRWAMSSFNNIDIYMISQGTSLVNISYVIDRVNLDEVLQELHKYLFEYQSL